uniref:Uncharacterized protein n=1 Tax=Oryctolagus cuniculus TaxID=9986 RepID=A0A5F9CX18_RABIT
YHSGLFSKTKTLPVFTWDTFQKCLAAESCYKVKLCETNNDFSVCKGG